MDGERERFCSVLQATSWEHAQETVNALLLCESVYKACDGGPEAAAEALDTWKSQFGGTCTLSRVQCALPHVQHRYVLASGRDALYVALQGTKTGRDLFTDLNFWFSSVWDEDDAQSAHQLSAHRGFLDRSRHIPAEALFAWAQQQGRRLIFSGHSLGGAVAVLCTLRLLRALGDHTGGASIRCITFGMPAIGNAALADHVSLRGWHHCFSSFVLPEDMVPRLMSAASAPARALATAEAQVAGEQQPGSGSTCRSDQADQLPRTDADAGEPALTPPASSSLPGYLRSWNALRGGALFGARSLQQALPMQPRFVHFGNYCVLPQLEPVQAAELADSAATQPSGVRSALLLAGHRMPSYRARMLRLAGSLAQTQGSAGAGVALCDSLAPQLDRVVARAMHPPLSPALRWKGETTAARWGRLQPLGSGAAARRWLPTGKAGSAGPSTVQMQICLVAAPGQEAALHSVTSVRLRQPHKVSLSTRWVSHPGPPSVQSASAAAVGTHDDPSPGMRLWLGSLLQRVRRPQQQTTAPHSLLDVQLPAAQAHSVLSQPQLSLKLRSDFAEAAVAVQLHRQQLWVLSDSAEASTQLLLQLADPSAARQPAASKSGAALDSDATEGQPARAKEASSSAWRRSRAWVGTLWAGQAAQSRAQSGVLPVGLQYTNFGGAGGSLEQQCAALQQLLYWMHGKGSGGASSGSQQQFAVAPALRLANAVRAVWTTPAARGMLHAERLPALLLCHVTQQSAGMQSPASACAAAAAAGVEVLIAVESAQAGALTSMMERQSKGLSPVTVWQLQAEGGNGIVPADAHCINMELYKMMLCSDSKSAALAVKSKL